MTDKMSAEEKNNAIKRMKKILFEFETMLKTAEDVYEDAMKTGDVKIQKEVQKQIEKIKREEIQLHTIILQLGGKT